MNKGDQSDITEIQKRVNLVYSMLLQGLQRKQVLQFISKKYEIGDRQIDNYIAKAREIISSDNSLELDTIKSQIVAQLWDLYHKNMKIEDYRECRNILNQVASVFGVNAPIKNITEHRGSKNIQDWLTKPND